MSKEPRSAWCAIVMDRDDGCGSRWLEGDNELHGGLRLPMASSSTTPMLSAPLIYCCCKMDAVAVDQLDGQNLPTRALPPAETNLPWATLLRKR